MNTSPAECFFLNGFLLRIVLLTPRVSLMRGKLQMVGHTASSLHRCGVLSVKGVSELTMVGNKGGLYCNAPPSSGSQP
jgi:hypothetical protein